MGALRSDSIRYAGREHEESARRAAGISRVLHISRTEVLYRSPPHLSPIPYIVFTSHNIALQHL